jgi:hypothetical protein
VARGLLFVDAVVTTRNAGRSRALVVACAVLAVGCAGTPRIVPLLRTAGAPLTLTPPSATPLEVISRSTAAPDPLPVRGSDVVYGDIESALGVAVLSATSPWAKAHLDHPVARQGGWALLVEITNADAEVESGGRVVFGMGVRATLRARSGNVYLGQTQVACREGGLLAAEEGAPVVYRCLTRVGRDLAGWLAGGVSLDPPIE